MPGDKTFPMAKDLEGVGEAVEKLLGLKYEDFVQCVVLPQGQFAAFLHAKPSDGRTSCFGCSAPSTTADDDEGEPAGQRGIAARQHLRRGAN